jgi:multidrug transporter EmrE-like cation transporter
MNQTNILICLGCAIAVAAGQVLMKVASVSWNETNALFNIRTLSWLVLAFSVYGVSSLVWIYVLRHVPLSQAYPLMSITFLLVPLASALFFSEKFDWINVASSTLIMAGISLNSLARHGIS